MWPYSFWTLCFPSFKIFIVDQTVCWSLCLFYREKNSQASKVFITTDLCGQKFLCFLVESQLQLRWASLSWGQVNKEEHSRNYQLDMGFTILTPPASGICSTSLAHISYVFNCGGIDGLDYLNKTEVAREHSLWFEWYSYLSLSLPLRNTLGVLIRLAE